MATTLGELVDRICNEQRGIPHAYILQGWGWEQSLSSPELEGMFNTHRILPWMTTSMVFPTVYFCDAQNCEIWKFRKLFFWNFRKAEVTHPNSNVTVYSAPYYKVDLCADSVTLLNVPSYHDEVKQLMELYGRNGR